jgi:hypothetical protein
MARNDARLSDNARALAADINARLNPTDAQREGSDVETLYRSMPDEVLVMVREAFRLDRERGTADPQFCAHRIALIGQILEERRR